MSLTEIDNLRTDNNFQGIEKQNINILLNKIQTKQLGDDKHE
jgi:hypothetical protein